MAGLREIIGNDLIKEQFEHAISADSVSHAYMLIGEKGMGKKTMAEGICLDLLCENTEKGAAACLECPCCKKILSRNHPDVIYLTHEKPDVISVEDLRRQINDTVGIRPYEGKYKIYVIDDAEKMTPQAQNALLKTLEEPPAYVVLLLLVRDPKDMLETVLSRCVKIKLKPRTDKQIREFLQKNYSLDETQIDLYVAFSRGNLGKAVSLLTNEAFSVWYHEVLRICRRIKTLDASELVNAAASLRETCPELLEALEVFQLWYRDLMMYKVTKDMNGLVFRHERKALMELAALSSYEGIEEIMEDIETCAMRLKANVNPELALELLLLNMKEK